MAINGPITSQSLAIKMAQEDIKQADDWLNHNPNPGLVSDYTKYTQFKDLAYAKIGLIYAKAGNRPLNQNELGEVLDLQKQVSDKNKGLMKAGVWEQGALRLYSNQEDRFLLEQQYNTVLANEQKIGGMRGNQYAGTTNPFNVSGFLDQFYHDLGKDPNNIKPWDYSNTSHT